ncbi:RNase H domain-containing protein [Trichonephila clavipes]|nr:RNase H domain-containing protein [Trichonephila clavipes]
MSALESVHFLTERRHPTVMEILLRKLERKGFDIIFSWVPGHVGILGNEQAYNAARSMSDPMQQPVCYQDLKTSIQRYVHHIWQEAWDQQILKKLHSIHPSTSHWSYSFYAQAPFVGLRVAETSGHQQVEASSMQPCSRVSDGEAGVEPRLETLELPDVLTSDVELQPSGPRRCRYGRLLKPRKGLNDSC